MKTIIEQKISWFDDSNIFFASKFNFRHLKPNFVRFAYQKFISVSDFLLGTKYKCDFRVHDHLLHQISSIKRPEDYKTSAWKDWQPGLCVLNFALKFFAKRFGEEVSFKSCEWKAIMSKSWRLVTFSTSYSRRSQICPNLLKVWNCLSVEMFNFDRAAC